MQATEPHIHYSLVAVTLVFVSSGLSRFMQPWLAWFIGGFCGVVPLWYSLQPEKRVVWKAILAGLGGGSVAALIIYFFN